MEQKVSSILMEKIDQTERNTQIIANEFQKNKENSNAKLSLEFPLQLKKDVIGLIEQLDFFKKKMAGCSLLKKTNMLKSNIDKSSALNISRNDQSHIIVQSPLPEGNKISYSDFILDPSKKYIFRVHLSSFSTKTSPDNFLLFGLTADNIKDSNHLIS